MASEPFEASDKVLLHGHLGKYTEGRIVSPLNALHNSQVERLPQARWMEDVRPRQIRIDTQRKVASWRKQLWGEQRHEIRLQKGIIDYLRNISEQNVSISGQINVTVRACSERLCQPLPYLGKLEFLGVDVHNAVTVDLHYNVVVATEARVILSVLPILTIKPVVGCGANESQAAAHTSARAAKFADTDDHDVGMDQTRTV